MRNIKEIVEELNAQETADLVADFLARQRVTGERGDASSCVIACWVQRETGISEAYVEDCVFYPNYDCDYDGYGYEIYDHIELSDAAQEFVDMFDNGKFPDLVVDDQPL